MHGMPSYFKGMYMYYATKGERAAPAPQWHGFQPGARSAPPGRGRSRRNASQIPDPPDLRSLKSQISQNLFNMQKGI